MENEVKIVFKGDSGQLTKAINQLDNATKKLLNTQSKINDFNKKNSQSTKRQSDSMRRLFIQLKANNQSFKDLGLSTTVLTKAFKGNRIAIAQVRNAMKSLNATNNQADVTTRILGGTFAVLRSKLLLAGFAMTTIVRPIGRLISGSASLENLKIAFNTLTGATEDSEVALNKLQEATNNTMSEFDLFQQANNAMVLGVTTNSDEMAEMFDIAQRLGRALGRDTASSVESLVTGIGRQSRLMLDNIGIIVKSEEAYEDYAEKLGITSERLTDAQKKQAFLEATMESARKKVKDLGDELPTTRDSLDEFSASVSNLGTTIGENIPFTDTLLKALTQMTNSVNNFIKGDEEIIKLEKDLNYFLQQKERILKSVNFVSKDLIKQDKEELKIIEKRIKFILKQISVLMDKDLADQKDLKNRKDILETEKKAQELREKTLAEEKKAFDRRAVEIQQRIQIAILTKELFDLEKARGITVKGTESEDLLNDLLNERLELVEQSTLALGRNANSLDFLDAEQRFAVESVRQLSSAFGDATINGQNMGEAVVSSLKAIASELIAQAGTYALLNLFTGGSFGVTTSFFKFITGHTGGLIKENGDIQRFANGGQVRGQDNVPIMAQAGEFIIRKAVVEQVGVDNLARLNNGESNVGSTVNVNINGNMIGNEEFVRDTLIPEINKTVTQGLA
tara:strand:- start:318 stop:2357 length:2040 start_codon:yes stop_codon:yes gene_type:complete